MFLLLNPLVGVSASALESEANESEAAREEVVEDAGDDEAMELAATSTDSTMNISFSPAAGTATAPIGTPTKFQVTAKVDIQNSGGYTIYFGSNSQNLTRKGGTETIAPISGNVEFNSLANNTWGYAVAEGNTVADNATYTAVPGSIRGRTIYTNNSTNIPSDSKTYTLSFAARIGTDKPAGTYENSVTMSVVSSPLIVTNDFGIMTMQEMTPTVCTNAKDSDGDGQITARLKDVRDDKLYWVKKMPDNKCWMVQNLALDLGTEWPDASLSDYDTPTTSYKPVATLSEVSTSTANGSWTATLSWNLGDYVINYPTSTYHRCEKSAKLSDCSYFTNVSNKTVSINPNFYSQNGATYTTSEYDAHYLVGNYYQYNTATAGTGGTITSGEASGSICPKGWRLPTGVYKTGDFDTLLSTAGITDGATLAGDGYFFVRAGMVYQNANLLYYAGYTLRYLSSTAQELNGPSSNAILSVNSPATAALTGSLRGDRMFGDSIRCIAR